MKNHKNKALKFSFLISFVYVGLGTLGVLCSYPPYYNDWVLFTLVVTLPVSIFGSAVMIAGKYYTAALIVQLFVFFLFWKILYNFCRNRFSKIRL